MRAFISYVNQDHDIVSRLAEELKLNGIDVWFDKTRLKTGQIWTTEIRNAIKSGDHFIACFSDNYWSRASTYMNKELSIAIEELQQRPHNTRWFIPICLTPCTVPDVPIGYGQYLSEIHAAHLFDSSFEALVASIVETIAPFYHKPERLTSYFIALESDDKLCAVRSLLSFLISADTDESSIEEIIKKLTKKDDKLIFDQCIELARRRLANKYIFKIMGIYCNPMSIAEVVPSILDQCKANLTPEEHGKLYRPEFSWYVSDGAYDEIVATFKEYDGSLSLQTVFKNLGRCGNCNQGWRVLVNCENRHFDGEDFSEETYICTHCKEEWKWES